MSEIDNFDSLFRSYLETRQHLPVAEIEDKTLLFSEGYLDSFNMVELVTWLEKNFSIKFGVLDFNTENLDSIERIRKFITRQIAQ